MEDAEMKGSSRVFGRALNPMTNILVRNRGGEAAETELEATQNQG